MTPRYKQVLAIVLAIMAIGLMGYQAANHLPGLASPDVDDLLYQLRQARTASIKADIRSQIHALGHPGVVRLRSIMTDQTREHTDRYNAMMLLTANPEAFFDLLSLIDDPDTPLREAARENVHLCISGGHYPRNASSDTEAQLLHSWFQAHQEEGYNIMSRAVYSRVSAGSDTTSSPEALFYALTRTGTVVGSSPYLADLRARGTSGTEAVIRITTSDSPHQRRLAYVVLGMLADPVAVHFLDGELRQAPTPSDIQAIQAALALARSSNHRPRHP